MLKTAPYGAGYAFIAKFGCGDNGNSLGFDLALAVLGCSNWFSSCCFTKRTGSVCLRVAKVNRFLAKWRTAYPKVVKSLQENPYIFTFYSFPESIRKSIYSTNLIESFNKQIKRYTKRKEQFPHEEALEKFLVAQIESYNQRFATRCHTDFDKARAELSEMFSKA